MKRTLLQVVQEYLDTTSGFYVDSIYDNDESQQVAKLAERVYYKMVQEFPNLLFTMKEMTLDSLSDVARPNYMLLPESIQKIQESQVYYNTSKTSTISYKRIIYLPPLKFIDMTNRSGGLNTIVVEGFDGNKMSVFTNQFPSYCTSFDMFLNEALTLIYQQPIGMIASRARSAKIKLQQDNRALGSSRGKKNYGRNGILGSYVPRGHGYE